MKRFLFLTLLSIILLNCVTKAKRVDKRLKKTDKTSQLLPEGAPHPTAEDAATARKLKERSQQYLQENSCENIEDAQILRQQTCDAAEGFAEGDEKETEGAIADKELVAEIASDIANQQPSEKVVLKPTQIFGLITMTIGGMILGGGLRKYWNERAETRRLMIEVLKALPTQEISFEVPPASPLKNRTNVSNPNLAILESKLATYEYIALRKATSVPGLDVGPYLKRAGIDPNKLAMKLGERVYQSLIDKLKSQNPLEGGESQLSDAEREAIENVKAVADYEASIAKTKAGGDAKVPPSSLSVKASIERTAPPIKLHEISKLEAKSSSGIAIFTGSAIAAAGSVIASIDLADSPSPEEIYFTDIGNLLQKRLKTLP